MSTDEQARELMAKNRQHQEHLHESMLNRASEEVEQPQNHTEEEKARELMAQERQQNEHLHESMLNRASEEVGLSQ
jgi:hypothetical protein